jgi:hypothetical protein
LLLEGYMPTDPTPRPLLPTATFRVSVTGAQPNDIEEICRYLEGAGLTVLGSGLTGLDVSGPVDAIEVALATRVVGTATDPAFDPPALSLDLAKKHSVRIYFPRKPVRLG